MLLPSKAKGSFGDLKMIHETQQAFSFLMTQIS